MSNAPTDRIDRRTFIGGVSAVAVSTLTPESAAQAESVAPTTAAAAAAGIYSIDDACGHWPPYSHPIPFGSPAQSDAVAHVDAIDRNFLV